MEKKIPIVKPSWIISCYETKRRLPLADFGLGVFSGLHVTITGDRIARSCRGIMRLIKVF